MWLLRVLLALQLLLGLGLPLHAHAHAVTEPGGAALYASVAAGEEHDPDDAQTCADCALCRLSASAGILGALPRDAGVSGASALRSPWVPGPGCAGPRPDPYASRDPPR